MIDEVSPTEFHEAEGVEDWHVVSDGATACFRTGSFTTGAQFVRAVGELPGIEEHPPDIDLRPNRVIVRVLTATAEYYGMSKRDIEVARQISAVAREFGLSADATAVQSVLIVPGAASTAEIMPFWRAVLGYEPRPDSPEEDLVDPSNRGPAFWLEQMDELRPDGGGAIHVAVWCRTSRPRRASPPPSLPAGGWCAMSLRPHGGRSPMQRVTRPTSRR